MKVLISKMFAGKFNEDSIGHEVINFFEPENCENSFIYHPPHGKARMVNNVVLVGKAEKYAYPVLAIANNVKKVKSDEYKDNIKYGNKYIKDINFLEEEFKKKNKITNKNNKINNLTFLVEKGQLKVPNSSIYIIPAKNDRFTEEKRLERINELEKDSCQVIKLDNENPQHDGCYCECVDNKNQDLKTLIESSKKWENFPLKKVSEHTFDTEYNDDNFLNFIEKENSEQIYTNMLCKILNYSEEQVKKDFVNLLVKKVPNKSINNIKGKIYITKEEILKDSKYKGRMDLLIVNESFLIVIENKIKSDLNGIFIEDDIRKTQIQKYTTYLEELKDKEYKNAQTFIFILKPNYLYMKNIDVDGVITYKELFNFFKENKNNQIKYYDEFLNALAKQSLIKEEEIKRRFLNMISK